MFFKILQFHNSNYSHIANFITQGDRNTACKLQYETDYVLNCLGDELQHQQLGLNYPVTFDTYSEETWPAFIIDLIPQGAARRALIKRFNRSDDEFLLANGALNPIGNIVVVNELSQKANLDTIQKGFQLHEIIDKKEQFIEYAEKTGTTVFGASDIQGDAPKFLAIKSADQLFYLNTGAHLDPITQQSYIIKFPRGKHQQDRLILKTEAQYMEVAQSLGLNVANSLHWQNDCLFIPRFDIEVTENTVNRFGLESFYSACDIRQSQPTHQLIFCKTILEHSSEAEKDLIEYLKRDILNSSLRNPDNHGRNSAFIKKGTSTRLSPLYDFAPMYLDPHDIFRRSSHWGELEQNSFIDWPKVVQTLQDFKLNQEHLIQELQTFGDKLKQLNQIMEEKEVDQQIVKDCQPWITHNINKLAELKV